jgi:hypothetical protein
MAALIYCTVWGVALSYPLLGIVRRQAKAAVAEKPVEEVLPKFETFDEFVAEKDGDAGGSGCARRS